MPEDKPPRGPASKIVRDRAMKILKETRAGMDPAFLERMSERFSKLVPQPPKPGAAPVKAPAGAEPVIPPAKPAPALAQDAGAEMVDKEKIRQIVLDYMKSRDDTSKH